MKTKEEIFNDLVTSVRRGYNDFSWQRRNLMELVADKFSAVNSITPDFSHIQTLEDFQQAAGVEIVPSQWQRGCRDLLIGPALFTDGYIPGTIYVYSPFLRKAVDFSDIYDVTFRNANEVMRAVNETIAFQKQLDEEWEKLVRDAHKADHNGDLGDAMVMAMLKNAVAGQSGIEISNSAHEGESSFRIKTPNGSDFTFYLKLEQTQDIQKVMDMANLVKDFVNL